MTSTQYSTRLTGRRLKALRLLWAGVAIGSTFLFLADLLKALKGVQAPGAPAPLPEALLAAYYLLLGLFIFWRRSDDWVAFGLSLTFMLFLTTNSVQYLFGPGPVTERIDLILAATASVVSGCLFYVFPDGRFTPRWTRWAAVVVVGIQLWRIFFEDVYMERGFPVVGLLFLTAPVAQIYRYYSTSDPVQRQQIKWLAISMAVTVPLIALGLTLYALSDVFQLEFGEQLGVLAWSLFLVVFPLSITVSILRYRLWDIDIIIRKTLQYAILSALLALVYFGSVLLLQTLFGAAMGDSPLLIVLSTLLIAALFTPLRRRVQAFIDRRFYRSKYDAARTLAQFAQTARDEVELEALTSEVTRVVQETLQPEQVGVWLRPAGGR